MIIKKKQGRYGSTLHYKYINNALQFIFNSVRETELHFIRHKYFIVLSSPVFMRHITLNIFYGTPDLLIGPRNPLIKALLSKWEGLHSIALRPLKYKKKIYTKIIFRHF